MRKKKGSANSSGSNSSVAVEEPPVTLESIDGAESIADVINRINTQYPDILDVPDMPDFEIEEREEQQRMEEVMETNDVQDDLNGTDLNGVEEIEAPTVPTGPTEEEQRAINEFRRQVIDAGPDHVWLLDPSTIIVDPERNGRTDEAKPTDKDVKELAESIKTQGQMLPGEVHLDNDGKLYLTFGYRRFAAIQLINSTRKPADQLPFKAFIRVNVDTVAFQTRNFHENAKRKELTVLDNVLVVTRFLGEGLNQKQVAEKTGWSPASVNNYVKISKFPDTVKEYIREGKLPARAALELTVFKTPVDIERAAKDLLSSVGTGKVTVTKAKKKAASIGKAATSQLTAKEFIDVLDFLFTKSNSKRLARSTEEILRIVGDIINGRVSQEKALDKLALYQ